jgi:hypothetical protein
MKKLEKILLGDDHLDFAKKAMPYIPGAEVTYLDDHEEVIAEAKTGDYDLVITDLQYTPNGTEGFTVLEELQDLDVRKILWTAAASQPYVKEKANELNVELLDKNELGTLVGMAVSEAPLKKDGKVLVYMAQNETDSLYKAMKQVVGTFFDPDKVVLGNKLKEELASNQYGLVIDTTTMPISIGDKHRTNGSVAHDLKSLPLQEVPKVVCVHDVTTVVSDVFRLVADFYNK